MISIAIILGLSAIIIASLALFWKKIVEWIKKAANKLKEVLGIPVNGTRTSIVKRIEGGFKNISRYYSVGKLTGEWEEYIYTKTVSEDEIPAEIRAKLYNAEYNEEISTTEELELQLNK